jgi:DNA-binding protein HU-beta
MTKADLVDEVVRASKLSKKQAETIVNTVFASIVGALHRDDKIELRGFGVFEVKSRKTGIGRNPRTGEIVPIAPGKKVRFKPGKEIKNL